MPLRKPDEFLKQGSKVFRRAPVDRDAIRGWVTIATGKTQDCLNSGNSTSTRLGTAYDVPPSEADVKLAIKSMNKIAPALLGMLADHLPR